MVPDMRTLAQYTKAWAAFAAGTTVFLVAGLITGSTAVWVSTAISAVGAAITVLSAPANAPKEGDHA